MKRARTINAIAWVIMAIILCTCVVIEWHQQGCGVKSLVLACAIYTNFCAALGVVIDLTIQGK